MEPSKYVGRAKEQVERFLNDVINPVLEMNQDLQGLSVEIHV